MVNKVPSKYFIWNNINSNAYGYLEKTIYPEFSAMSFEFQYVPCRSTPLILSKDIRNMITISVNLQHVPRAKYNEMYGWLNNENHIGKLTICDDLKKYYKAVCTSVKPVYSSYNYSNVDITFECYPYRYSVENLFLLVQQSPTTIENSGTYYSEPTINVFGNGDGTITINDKTITLKDIKASLMLDSERLIAYNDVDNTIYLNKMVGEFPILLPGKNTISWSGGISELQIMKNERWL